MAERTGFRREANQMGMLSELVEKTRWLTPRNFSLSHEHGTGVTLHMWAWGAWSDKLERCMTSEEEMLRNTELFGPDVKWTRNDPTESNFDESYYQMRGEWNGIKVCLITGRAGLCEKVVTMEYVEEQEIPDPELVEKIPLKKVSVTKQIVEWQCNEALSAVNQ